MKYKAAAVQMEVNSPDKQENLAKALRLLDGAVAEGAKAICFPDYFLTDTPTVEMKEADLKTVAEPIPGPTIDKFAKAAQRHKVYVVAGSILEMGEDHKIYSTSTFIGPDGNIVGKVRKMHPENAPAKREIGCGVTPDSSEFQIFRTDIGNIGIMIDMDGVAVEVPRILGLKGADVIFWPLNFSVRFTEGIHLMNRFNSMTARAFLVSCCRSGWKLNTPVHSWGFMGRDHVDLMYGGGSGIAFNGSYLATVPDFTEGFAIATIDTDKPAAVRKLRKQEMPLERRPELYGLIAKP